MSLYFALKTVENNKNTKSVKFHRDMLNFCDFIQVFVFTTNYHLNIVVASERLLVSWLFWIKRPFEIVFQSLSGRL